VTYQAYSPGLELKLLLLLPFFIRYQLQAALQQISDEKWMLRFYSIVWVRVGDCNVAETENFTRGYRTTMQYCSDQLI